MTIHYEETKYGFDYGAAKITRIYSDEKTGAVWVAVDTPKRNVQVYVTKTGKVRVWDGSVELVKEYVVGENDIPTM